MGKLDNAVLELRPGAGQGKTIPIPITAIGFLASDGTGRDVSAADPMPTIDAGVKPSLLSAGINQGENTHTTSGAAESITGFTAGATIEIYGSDCEVYVGADAASAQAHGLGRPAGVPFRFTLDGTETSFHADCSADLGIYRYSEVN